MAGSRLLVTTNGKLVPCGPFSKIPQWQTQLSFNLAYAGVLAEVYHNLELRRFEFGLYMVLLQLLVWKNIYFLRNFYLAAISIASPLLTLELQIEAMPIWNKFWGYRFNNGDAIEI